MGPSAGLGSAGVAFAAGGGGVETGTGSRGVANAVIGGAALSAGVTGLDIRSDDIGRSGCDEKNNAYSPPPPPATAAMISTMVTMWLELRLEPSGCRAGFFSVGVTGVSPNSQMV